MTHTRAHTHIRIIRIRARVHAYALSYVSDLAQSWRPTPNHRRARE